MRLSDYYDYDFSFNFIKTNLRDNKVIGIQIETHSCVSSEAEIRENIILSLSIPYFFNSFNERFFSINSVIFTFFKYSMNMLPVK